MKFLKKEKKVIEMKKKLLAVVLSVVMIAALFVPMMVASAAGELTATLSLDNVRKTTRVGADGVTSDVIAVDVKISGNTGYLFVLRYLVVSEDGLVPYTSKVGRNEVKGYEGGTFASGDTALNYAGTANGEEVVAIGKTGFQVLCDSTKGDLGIETADGFLGTAYFVAPTDIGTYTFKLIPIEATNDGYNEETGANDNVLSYDIKLGTETVTYTVECTEHKEGEAEIIKAATCTEDGESVVSCTVCGKELKKNVIKKLGHDLDGGVVAEGVKCGETADTTYSCQRDGCDYTEKKTGAKVEHAMEIDKEASKEATCTDDGVEVTKCTREGCDHSVTKTIAKLGHALESDQAAGEAPTCTEDGKVVDKCTRCDYVEETKIDKLGHDMVADAENSKEATCYAEGVEAKKCSREGCDHTETKAIAKTEHAFNGKIEVITAPTAEAEGKYTVACSNDGCTEVEEKTAAKLAAEVKGEGITVKAEDAILPEDINLVVTDGDVDEDKKVATLKVEFASSLVDNLTGKVDVAVELEGAKKVVVTTVDAEGNTVTVESEFKNEVLTFAADLAGEYVITAELATTSPETADATNVVVFAIAALMAVAGLVVVGKKRFAL